MRLAWIVVAALALAPSIAHAQIDDARRHLENADFSRAIRAYDRAETSEGLTRADLIALYEGRAMARWALGQEDEARHDLLALGTLDPEHDLPPEAPPDLRSAFEQMPRRALRVSLAWDDAPGRTTLRVTLENDDANLVREVRTHVRRGEEPWTTELEREIEIAYPDAGIMVWIEAIGPGEAVVAGEGTALAPIQHGLDVAIASAPAESSDMTPVWIGVGVAAGVAVVAIIVLSIVLGLDASETTQPTAPFVIGF